MPSLPQPAPERVQTAALRRGLRIACSHVAPSRLVRDPTAQSADLYFYNFAPKRWNPPFHKNACNFGQTSLSPGSRSEQPQTCTFTTDANPCTRVRHQIRPPKLALGFACARSLFRPPRLHLWRLYGVSVIVEPCLGVNACGRHVASSETQKAWASPKDDPRSVSSCRFSVAGHMAAFVSPGSETQKAGPAPKGPTPLNCKFSTVSGNSLGRLGFCRVTQEGHGL